MERDPDYVLAAVKEAVSQALADTGAPDIGGVTLTSQAQTFARTDSEFNPVSPFISWLDARAPDACQAFSTNQGMDHFSRHCSFPTLIAALLLSQLKRIRDRHPD